MPAIQTIQLLGLVGVASYALGRVAARLPGLSYSRAKLIAVRTDAFPEMPRGYSIVEHRTAPLPVEIDVDPGVQALRFAAGARCLAAYNDKGAFVGVAWFACQSFEEDDTHVRYVLPTGTAWDTGLWIPPRYRMGRALAALWAGMAFAMRADGLTWTISRIADYNLPSLHAHRRLAPISLGTIVFAQIGRWYWCSRAEPRWRRLPLDARSTVDLSALPPLTARE